METFKPFIRIIEQPSKSLRYRYNCEGRAEKIYGASSTAENKVPIGIQIVGYEGKVVVIVSCVTKDPPHKPHPHKLSGDNCRKGMCTLEAEITSRNNIVTFPKLAIQCVKRNDIYESLKHREEKNVDPFMTGFEHKNDPKSIDLHVVRLCFQVLLIGDRRTPLTPVVSESIINKKLLPDPLIYRLSHCNSPVNGRNDDIILLCTKIIKDDIKIRFFETRNGQVIWEDYGAFQPNSIYNQSAICFKPPPYHNLYIPEPVKVSLQLLRPSDGATSPCVPFEFLPLRSEGRESRKKLVWDDFSIAPPKVAKLEQAMSLPLPVNDINEASPRKSEDVSSFNIVSDDLGGLDSGRISEFLKLNYGTNLEPLNLSSGDLEMADVETLSGSLQNNLVF